MLGRRTGFAWLFLVACSSSSAAPGDDAPRGSDAPARDAPATIFPDPGATPPGSIPDAGPVADPVSREGDGDFVIGPSYADAPEYGIDGLPKGQISSVRLESFASRIYPSNIANGRRFQRDIWTYLPAGYVPGTEVPFMIAQDGGDERDRLPPILDVLIAQKRLPPMVVVMINPGPGDGPGSQRGLEYDRVSPDYGTFIETEILPFLAEMYQIKFTTNPEGRASMGTSSGGAAALTMAWFRPELYRRVLTYSGTFVNQHPEPAFPHGAWEYHENLIPKADRRALRIALEVGERDNNFRDEDATLRNWVLANQHMAAVLKAKDYHYRFLFAKGAGHVDGRVIYQTLPAMLEWLWRGYPIK